jgi:hypothetical protein
MLDDNFSAPAPKIQPQPDTRIMTVVAKPVTVPGTRRKLPPAGAELPERDSVPAAALADMLDRSQHAEIRQQRR